MERELPSRRLEPVTVMRPALDFPPFSSLLIVAGLIVAALLVSCQEYGAEDAPPGIRKAKIAFMEGRDIYVMNIDGTGRTRLTRDIRYFSWSPDGTYVAFASDRDHLRELRAGRDSRRYLELYVMKSDGSNPVRLTDDDVELSRDGPLMWVGEKIAFNASDVGIAMYLINPDGTGLERFPDRGFPRADNLSFCQEENLVVFVYSQDIYVKDLDEAIVTRITDTPSVEKQPDWSPDCQRIVFLSDRDGNDEIYTMKRDGSQQTRLTETDFNEHAPSWSPVGNRIAFLRGRSGGAVFSTFDLYVISLDAAKTTRLLTGELEVRGLGGGGVTWGPKWSPTADWILFEFQSLFDIDVVSEETYIAAADGSRLIELEGVGAPAVWIP